MTGAETTGAAGASGILARSRSILLIDWPSRDVPATLAAAGFAVTVKGGPGPTDYTAWELTNGKVVTRRLGRAPGHADLVYCYRPFAELPGIIVLAQRLGAAAIWRQSGLTSTGARAPDGCWLPPQESQQGRELAAAAGLTYMDDVYIADAARKLAGRGPGGLALPGTAASLTWSRARARLIQRARPGPARRPGPCRLLPVLAA
jgi:hypothetical protein